jgi:hypothetical protein
LSSSLGVVAQISQKIFRSRRQAELVEQKLAILLTIRALFVSYAPRFNSSQLFVVDPAFSNLIL